METIFYSISIFYALCIFWFILGFIRLKPIRIKNQNPSNRFTVIIPFRNEANNLLDLLSSLQKLNYPRSYFEVFLIDDFSTDNSVAIIEKFKRKHPEITIQILQNIHQESPKKAAITLGIQHAKWEWIVTTDADCSVPENWLKTFDYAIQNSQSKMLCGPVKLHIKLTFSGLFEILNFNSLQGATMGSFGWNQPILCNGANLCYNKHAFLDVDGFEGNKQIASGDDIFLLEKFKKHFPESMQFLKCASAIVTTKTQHSFSNFIAQQQRWAAKSKSYKNAFTKIVGATVLLENVSMVSLLFFAISNVTSWELFFNCMAIKMIADTALIFQSLHFYKQEKLALASFPMSFVYPLFSVVLVVLSLFRTYQWKGRDFKS